MIGSSSETTMTCSFYISSTSSPNINGFVEYQFIPLDKETEEILPGSINLSYKDLLPLVIQTNVSRMTSRGQQYDLDILRSSSKVQPGVELRIQQVNPIPVQVNYIPR